MTKLDELLDKLERDPGIANPATILKLVECVRALRSYLEVTAREYKFDGLSAEKYCDEILKEIE